MHQMRMTAMKRTARKGWLTGAWFAGALCLAGCAGPGSTVEIQTQASGNPYFSLTAPTAYKIESGMELAGRVCRKVRTTLLSPSSVRLEHIAISGDRLQVARASVGAIYRSADQACTRYAAHVAWIMADGESVRACFDRGRACPIDSPAKTVITAPSPIGRQQ